MTVAACHPNPLAVKCCLSNVWARTQSNINAPFCYAGHFKKKGCVSLIIMGECNVKKKQ